MPSTLIVLLTPNNLLRRLASRFLYVPTKSISPSKICIYQYHHLPKRCAYINAHENYGLPHLTLPRILGYGSARWGTMLGHCLVICRLQSLRSSTATCPDQYGGGTPHLSRKISQCSPNCAPPPTIYDNKLNTRSSSLPNFSALVYQIVVVGG